MDQNKQTKKKAVNSKLEQWTCENVVSLGRITGFISKHQEEKTLDVGKAEIWKGSISAFTWTLQWESHWSYQFSRSVMSDSLRPHESQHARPPCPSPTPEFTQTIVHRVGDAIQPSYPLSSPSPPAPNPSQHQGLFQWVSSSHEVAKVLVFQL